MERMKFEELKERILEHKEKAGDMDVMVNAIKKLPYGQLKKVLSQEVLDVLAKYGYTGTENSTD